MKKLVMMLVACAVAIAANAASVNWQSGTAIKNAAGTAYPAAGAITMYVFEFASSTDIAGLSAADIYALDTSSAKLSGTTTKAGTNISLTDSTTYGAGDNIYSAVLLKYTEGDTEYYVAQTVSGAVDGLGGDVVFKNTGKTAFGTTTALSWTEGTSAGTPEPTSGLLLLLGGAMLALRRKQK